MARRSRMQPVVRIIPPGELKVYAVYEHQLDELARGSSTSLLLNFALFFLGIAPTAFGTILSVPPTNLRAYVTFLLLGLVTLVAGVVLLSLWLRLHRSSKSLLAQIKAEPAANPELEGARDQGESESESP